MNFKTFLLFEKEVLFLKKEQKRKEEENAKKKISQINKRNTLIVKFLLQNL